MISNIKRAIRKHGYLEMILTIIALVEGITRFHALYDAMYVVNHGLPQELREGVAVKLAVEFAKGNNPYSVAYNEINVPIINHYGWFTAFFLSIFLRVAKIFTIARPEIICTLVTLGIIAIGCLAMWGAAYEYSKNLFISTIASVIALSCYWRLTFNGGSFPDAYGLTLSFILMWIVEYDNKRKKYRLPLYILIVIIMFYTKQYFVLCGVGIFIWLLVHDKRVAIRYLIYGFVSGIVSMILVNLWLPLYFTESLLYSGGTNTSDHNVEYEKMQFQVMYDSYKPLFMILICCAIVSAMSVVVIVKKKNYEDLKKAKLIVRYDAVMAFLGGLACIRIGQHAGALYSYYLQIWIPYILSFSLVCANEIAKRNIKDNQYTSVLVMLLLLLVPKTCDRFYNTAYVSEENMHNWTNVYSALDKYSCGDGTKILVGDPLSFYAIERNYEAYDYGSNEYAYYGLLNDVNPSIISFFPRAEWLIERVENTRLEARNKIEEGAYSCLAIMQGNPCGITTDFVDKTGKYELDFEADLQTGGQVWHTYVYRAKEMSDE